MGLTDKQRVWLEEYLQCWNATEAARRADYAYPNTQGPRLLLDVGMQEEIENRIKEMSMSADQVLLALSEIAEGSIENYMDIDEDGKLSFNFKRAQAEGKMHLIKKVVPTQSGLRVELHDRMDALQLIGKHYGMFKDVHEHTGKDGVPLIPVSEIIDLIRSAEKELDDDSDG